MPLSLNALWETEAPVHGEVGLSHLAKLYRRLFCGLARQEAKKDEIVLAESANKSASDRQARLSRSFIRERSEPVRKPGEIAIQDLSSEGEFTSPISAFSFFVP